MTLSRADMIRDTITDLVSDFVRYDRADDRDLPPGAIQEAVAAGEITVAEMVGLFADDLRAELGHTDE